jgi:hypothetical protein
MTTDLALAYISRRMEELGYGNNYFIKCRHFSLQPEEERVIDAYNELFIFIDGDNEVVVSSEFGVYDLNDAGINEQQYEHQGKLTITNKAKILKQVKFIQAIPKHP